MKFENVYRNQYKPDGGRLQEFFDIDSDNPTDMQRALEKTISTFQDKHTSPTAPAMNNMKCNYAVSGWDEVRITKYIQNKAEQGTKKTAEELFAKIKMFSNQEAQLPAIYEDEWGNIWTKEGEIK